MKCTRQSCLTPTNLFRDHVSLPGLSTRLMSDHLCAQNGGVTGFYVPSVEISSLIREELWGGLSVCMQRECIKGVTPIRSHIYGGGCAKGRLGGML